MKTKIAITILIMLLSLSFLFGQDNISGTKNESSESSIAFATEYSLAATEINTPNPWLWK